MKKPTMFVQKMIGIDAIVERDRELSGTAFHTCPSNLSGNHLLILEEEVVTDSALDATQPMFQV